MIDVRRATREDAEACIEILTRLPDYFTSETHAQTRAGISDHLVWVAIDVDAIAGFVLVERRYATSAEVVIAAVTPERQGAGIGTRLARGAWLWWKCATCQKCQTRRASRVSV